MLNSIKYSKVYSSLRVSSLVISSKGRERKERKKNNIKIVENSKKKKKFNNNNLLVLFSKIKALINTLYIIKE